jgi:2-succinyl-5-enolpyruvyl-6-hydroxy-3-cyclohexene-1-carboxylate synthase
LLSGIDLLLLFPGKLDRIMNKSIIPLANKIAEMANLKGINHAVLSPGSRSAPITVAFVRHPKVKTYLIPDERSAGYIAMGMSLALKEPVVVVSTSGTASINLYPSVAEAFYQNIPLIVLTADRPPEWIGQADGQTVHQDYLYGKHVKKYYSFPIDQNFNDAEWYVERIVNEAINLAEDSRKGPVHINLPIREPFYPDDNEKYDYNTDPKIIHSIEGPSSLDDQTWIHLGKTWGESERVLVVGGQHRLNKYLQEVLDGFTSALHIPVVADCIANLHELNRNIFTKHDLILNKLDRNLELLAADLLITFGNAVLSKKLKLFLRNHSPKVHWHIQESGYCPDTFQSLTETIKLREEDFFHKASAYFKESPRNKSYIGLWKDYELEVQSKIQHFFPRKSFSELEAVFQILKYLPEKTNLHLANSMPVRLVNLIGAIRPGTEVFSNRGTSGIDGCTSTAIGVSLHSDRLNVLISGDMAFFYDRNGLWHNHIPGNLRIIILNNHGGGIFRLIDGPSKLPELEEYFETKQKLMAENTARDFEMDYLLCKDLKGFQKHIQRLWVDDGKAKILEIETNSQINKSIFDKYISQL